ncbi:hypothetical protein PIB30_050222 [Stylosanthes scabra]|uniref:DUF7746 domain-containing protein n=1 Tax=Stylosanthes scabra TaxID=79078 RepID=A0ABU6XF88_9FABA|nr:hypothetical protein [Stylosanthes scabra]
MKEGSIPAAFIYRIQYKVMNTCNSRVLLKSSDRETTLFVTDMTMANITVPRLIKLDEIDLPKSWSIDRAIPTQPRQAPFLQEIKLDETGRVEIFFDRRNSFSSRSEAGTSIDFASARRSFSVTSQSQFSTRIPRYVNSGINISESSDSEVMQKIDQLLNRLSTVPKTPTNSGESTSRIQTRSSKAACALNKESNESSESDISHSTCQSNLRVSPIMTNSLTKWKGLTKPFTSNYNRISALDLALEERELGFVSFNANNIYEWNIDGKTEYNIMSMLQHMTMVGIAYQTAHESSEEAIAISLSLVSLDNSKDGGIIISLKIKNNQSFLPLR